MSPSAPLSQTGSGGASQNAPKGLRPFDPSALPGVMGMSRAKFAALNAHDWSGLVAGVGASPAAQSQLMRALAWGLEAKDLLRWACLAARLEEVLSGRETRSEALVLTDRWLREGEEAVRYQTYRQASQEEFETPGALAGLAAYVSGPSLAPQGAPREPPSPNMGRKCAANVLVVAATSEALNGNGFEHINTIGRDLARGGDGRIGARQALADAQRAAR